MIRIGVDFGGTKIEAAALDAEGNFQARVRAATPRDYVASIACVHDLVREAEAQAGVTWPGGRRHVGVAAPGSVSPKSGMLRNANSQFLNGKPFRKDLSTVLDAEVRIANDANCLALSEAVDGVAASAGVVFAAILGTGCGGGLVVHRRLIEGAQGIAGEWGHSPLPWMHDDEHPGLRCWCGKHGCIERYLSGTGFEEDFAHATGRKLAGADITQTARSGDAEAQAALERYIDRLGRCLALICNIIDPDIIVLGGGMSNVPELYTQVPEVIGRWVFSDVFATPMVAAKYGNSSGVRGAAWLWGLEEL